MPESQTGLKSIMLISDTLKTEPIGRFATPTLTVLPTMSVLTTCGNMEVKQRLPEDAGSLPFAQVTELTGCSMEERSNGGVTPIHHLLLMVLILHMV